MLKKLSLAALVALGSVSFANATDLSEAVKGVDFSGYLRLRAYSESDKTYTNRWRTTSLFKFAVPVSDDLKFHTDYALDWNMYNDASANGSVNQNNVHMYLDAKVAGANVLFGKIAVATPVTGAGVGEALGAGAIATYKINDQFTVAAAALDTLANTDLVTVGGNDTYAAAIIGNLDVAKFQAWYFNVDNIIDSDIVVSADVNAGPVAIHADFATASLDSSISDDTQTYINVNAGFNKDAISAKVGYAVTGKDGGTVVLDADAPIASVFATEQQTGIANTKDNYALYANVDYKMDEKTTLIAAYSAQDVNSANEALVGAKYAYTKKFGLYVYYSMLNQDSKDADGNKLSDNNEARIEAKYTF